MNLLPYKCVKCGKVYKIDSNELTVKNGRYITYCSYCGEKQEKL